jgi:hypothetical protein
MEEDLIHQVVWEIDMRTDRKLPLRGFCIVRALWDQELLFFSLSRILENIVRKPCVEGNTFHGLNRIRTTIQAHPLGAWRKYVAYET